MKSTSVIELSSSAIEHNIRFLKSIVGEKVKISSVVKGNAYGHGIDVMVPMIEKAGIDHFSVFSSDEARRVHLVVSPETRIAIMGYIINGDFSWVVENEIEFFVARNEILLKAIGIAKEKNCKLNIHLDVETGMNRLGAQFPELEKIEETIQNHRNLIIIKGVCTHLAGAESIANYVRIHKQIKRFFEIKEYLANLNIIAERYHVSSSAASITYPNFRLDMVRIGIMQFGFWPSRETFIHFIHNRIEKFDPLKRVLCWKSKVMDIKSVNQGEFIGYGNNFQAYRNMKIAIIPIGYSGGYSRSLSNMGKVLINGERIAIIGMVNMNMLIANVSKLENIKIGDPVVLIGRQGKHSLSVASFTEMSQMVNYELLSRLPMDIQRVKTK